MSRDTSIDAYIQIKEDGTLGRLQWATYDCLFRHGPLTTRQIHKRIKHIARDVGIVSTRLTELERMGSVSSVGTVECEETGKTVILWDVTSKIPVKKEKKKKGEPCPLCDGTGRVWEP